MPARKLPGACRRRAVARKTPSKCGPAPKPARLPTGRCKPRERTTSWMEMSPQPLRSRARRRNPVSPTGSSEIESRQIDTPCHSKYPLTPRKQTIALSPDRHKSACLRPHLRLAKIGCLTNRSEARFLPALTNSIRAAPARARLDHLGSGKSGMMEREASSATTAIQGAERDLAIYPSGDGPRLERRK